MSITLRRTRRHRPSRNQRAFDFLDELRQWQAKEKADKRAKIVAERKAAREAARALFIAERKAKQLAERRERAREKTIERKRLERARKIANQKASPCRKCGKLSLKQVCTYCSHLAEGLPRIEIYTRTRPDPFLTDEVKAALATCEISDESQRVADEWIVAATARIRETWSDEEYYERAGKIRSLWSAPESTPQDDHHG